jgi:hypothetical protein
MQSKYCWLVKKTIKKSSKKNQPQRHSSTVWVQIDLSKITLWSSWTYDI